MLQWLCLSIRCVWSALPSVKWLKQAMSLSVTYSRRAAILFHCYLKKLGKSRRRIDCGGLQGQSIHQLVPHAVPLPRARTHDAVDWKMNSAPRGCISCVSQVVTVSVWNSLNGNLKNNIRLLSLPLKQEPGQCDSTPVVIYWLRCKTLSFDNLIFVFRCPFGACDYAQFYSSDIGELSSALIKWAELPSLLLRDSFLNVSSSLHNSPFPPLNY